MGGKAGTQHSTFSQLYRQQTILAQNQIILSKPYNEVKGVFFFLCLGFKPSLKKRKLPFTNMPFSNICLVSSHLQKHWELGVQDGGLFNRLFL